MGRRPEHLDATEITRAVIESVAENTVDAVVAPAMWAAVAGAPGALAYRAVNTLDAMVGHHNRRYEDFGWASARVDDLVIGFQRGPACWRSRWRDRGGRPRWSDAWPATPAPIRVPTAA